MLEVGKVAVSGTSDELARDESVRKSLPGVLAMAEFFQQVVAGLASGSIYAALALALVLIHRATGVINFAQGEMAMFTTYIAWTLIDEPRLVVLAGVRRHARCSRSCSASASSAP